MNDDILWKVVELGKAIENLINENNFWKRKCNDMGIALNTYEKGKYQEHLENEQLHSIVKETKEYIEHAQNYGKEKHLYINGDDVLKILDKVEKENDIEFGVLKALNTDLDDDVEMG